jgi:hypothetical protein
MSIKYSCNVLSVKSIKRLKADLQKYRDSLTDKCEEVVRRLSQIGLDVIEQEIAAAGFTYEANKNGTEIESGSDTEHYSEVKITTLDGYAHADITVQGKDIAFIEFGSGVFYNGAPGTSPHPKGQEFGFVIGSYGQGNGVKKIWGYYDESGTLVLTHGTKATMPMYKAFMKMYEESSKIVREVFGGA